MTAAELPPAFRASLEGTKVEYVRLGKSGLKVSVPILGAMSIGDPAWNSWVIDEEKVLGPPTYPRHSRSQTYLENRSPCRYSKQLMIAV